MSAPSPSGKLRLLASLCDRLADSLRDIAAVLRTPETNSPLPPYLLDECATTTGGDKLTWYDADTVGPVVRSGE